MNRRENGSKRQLESLFPILNDARMSAQEFIVSNGLKEKLSIGSKIGEGLILEDVLAAEVISRQIGAADSKIRRLRLGNLSRRRVLGAYTRHAIRLLEERATSLSWAFGYVIKDTELHRETYCKTPAQVESVGIVAQAVDELILIADEKDVPIADRGRFKNGDLDDWKEKYREKLYAVT